MRRFLGLFAAALLALTLSACGGDDGGGDGDNADESTTSTTDGNEDGKPDISEAERQAAETLATRLQEAAGGIITDEQANCIADEFLEATDLAALAEQLAKGQDPRNDPALQSTLLSALIGCVPPEVLSQLTSTASSTG